MVAISNSYSDLLKLIKIFADLFQLQLSGNLVLIVIMFVKTRTKITRKLNFHLAKTFILFFKKCMNSAQSGEKSFQISIFGVTCKPSERHRIQIFEFYFWQMWYTRDPIIFCGKYITTMYFWNQTNSCSDTEQLYSNVCKYYGRLDPIIFWGSTNYTFLELEEQYLTWNNLNSDINKYPGGFSSLLCFWESIYQPHIILKQGEQ